MGRLGSDRTREERDEEETEAQSKAAEHEDLDRAAEENVKALEGDPPTSLDDWPDGQAKYKTFGGPEHESSWDEGATAKLGEGDSEEEE